MKAAQYVSLGQVALVDVPMAEPASGEVLLQLDRLAICGSDINVLYGAPPQSFPFQPGLTVHECTGVVVDPNGSDYRVGDRVLIIPPRADALVEYLAVEPPCLIPLPDSIRPELAVLAQQLGTVIFCCKKLSNMLDKIVVVVGQGPAGVFFSLLLNRMGAKQVIGLDIVQHRLEISNRLGATHIVNVQDNDPIAAVRDLTGGQMADVVVEACGKLETINLCPELIHIDGELVLFGIPELEHFPFAYGRFFRKYLRTVSSANAQGEPGLRSFQLALDFIREQRIDLTPVVSHQLPFDRISDAFRLAHTKEDGALKVVIQVAT
jgi:threonine dehydrogenase-like Zn-dependent dehydrogenase